MKALSRSRMLLRFEAIAPNGYGVILIGQQIVGLHFIHFLISYIFGIKVFLSMVLYDF